MMPFRRPRRSLRKTIVVSLSTRLMKMVAEGTSAMEVNKVNKSPD